MVAVYLWQINGFVIHPGVPLIHTRSHIDVVVPSSSLLILHDIPTLLSDLLTPSPQPYDSQDVLSSLAVPYSDHRQLQILESGIETMTRPSMNYAPAATTLFVNMLTPASILAAAMISLGMKKPFEVSRTMKENPHLRDHIENLRRTYIVVTMVSFCSELLAVMWGTVAVNQLTEQSVAPTHSVWELLRNDVDLEWAAVNSHFVLGLIGFMYMVGIRGYVMLLAAGASEALIVSTLSGISAALLLMVSVVNRGVQAGGGNGVGYGSNILDLFGHYVSLLYKRATGTEVLGHLSSTPSVGPLAVAAIFLELMSVGFALYAILSPLVDRTMKRTTDKQEHPDHSVTGATGSLPTVSSTNADDSSSEVATSKEIDLPPSPL
jgi:hypothetical protein